MDGQSQITLLLGSPPYGGQDIDTVLGIAQAALKKGGCHSRVKRGLDTEELVEDMEFINHRKVAELMSANRLQLEF